MSLRFPSTRGSRLSPLGVQKTVPKIERERLAREIHHVLNLAKGTQMAIYKRNSGRWAVLVDVDRRADGARARRALGTYRTHKDAQRAEREALAARDRGINLSPHTVTLAELMRRYLERCRTKNLAPASLERYGEITALHILPTLAEVPLARSTRGPTLAASVPRVSARFRPFWALRSGGPSTRTSWRETS